MRIRGPRPPGPYDATPIEYTKKYEEEDHTKMTQDYEEMRSAGETVAAPLMEIELTNDGASDACVPMALEEPSDDDGGRGGVLPEEPPGAEN